MAIKGLFSGRYLAMNKRGRLYASVSPGARVGGGAQTEQPAPSDITSEGTQDMGSVTLCPGTCQDQHPCPTAPRPALFCPSLPRGGCQLTG